MIFKTNESAKFKIFSLYLIFKCQKSFERVHKYTDSGSFEGLVLNSLPPNVSFGRLWLLHRFLVRHYHISYRKRFMYILSC